MGEEKAIPIPELPVSRGGAAEKLCWPHCIDEEIAAWFSVSVLYPPKPPRAKQSGDVMRRDEAKGRIRLRRARMRLVEAGNVPMLWLGKNLLRQRDNHDSAFGPFHRHRHFIPFPQGRAGLSCSRC